MAMRYWRVGMFVLGIGWVGNAFAGPTVEEVTKKITEASKNLKSFSAKVKMVTEMKQEGFSMTSKMDGTIEMMRKGDHFMMRNETEGVSETSVAGQTNKQETSSVMINDGEYQYTLSEMGGAKSAYKSKHQGPGPDEDPFQAWRETADLKVLPDESVEGMEVWVIEVTPKEGQFQQGKSLLYFHKDSGQMIKMVVNTPDGTPMTTMTYSDIKINPKVDADRFEFKPPPGVTVQEM